VLQIYGSGKDYHNLNLAVTNSIKNDQRVTKALEVGTHHTYVLPTWQDIHVWESLAGVLPPLEGLRGFCLEKVI